jgi:Protein of unknown function (DUF2961)
LRLVPPVTRPPFLPQSRRSKPEPDGTALRDAEQKDIFMNVFRACCGLAALLILTVVALRGQQSNDAPDRLFDNLYRLRDTKTARISSYDRTGGNFDWITIAPGETKTLAEISGAGVIRRFYVAPYSLDRMRYRKLVLRMYWDGQKDPCVEVPIGDFFGAGLGTLRYIHSLVVDINPGFRGWDFDGLVSYFPMPFEKGARITLENDGDVKGFRLWYHIEYETFADGKLPPNSGRFHAQWRRVAKTPVRAGALKNSTLGNATDKNTTGNDNYVILDTVGRGTYVGLFLTVDNIAGGWYGEGDDMIFIDGEKWPPTYPGTGHEEVFNWGCCPNAESFGLYTGFYLIENLNGDFGGKNQMYKFYINDPVRFQKSIRVTLEHGHDNNFENDYTTTAFWYQEDPHKEFPALPAAKDRLPAWPDGVAQAIERETAAQNELYDDAVAGKIHIAPDDGKLLQRLTASRNKEFRELDYQGYIRDVDAMVEIAARYAVAKDSK